MPVVLPSLPYPSLLGRGDFSDLYLEESQSLSIRWEDGKIQSIVNSLDSGVGLRTIDQLKTRTLHLDVSRPFDPDWSVDVLRHLRQMSDQLNRDVSVKKMRWLGPNPGALRTHSILTSPSIIPLKQKVELLEKAYHGAMTNPLIRQVTINYSEKSKTIGIVTSNGKSSLEERVYVVMSIHVTAERNGDLQSAYESLGGIVGWELFDRYDVAAVAKMVAERALKKLDASSAPTGEMPVVISSSAGGTLIHEAVGHSLEADAVLEGTSPSYKGKMGSVVANEKLTVLDDPTVPGARGSFHVDDEGTPSERSVLIEKGVLKDLMFDQKSAMKTGRMSNGHARRESFAHRPIPRMSNTMIAPGTDNPSDILQAFQNGFLVTKMGGGQVNTANGDFVFDVEEGFQVKDGKRTMVRGATLLGNGPEVLKNIDLVGTDLGWGLGTCGKEGQGVPVGDAIPTIRIKKLVIGGQ